MFNRSGSEIHEFAAYKIRNKIKKKNSELRLVIKIKINSFALIKADECYIKYNIILKKKKKSNGNIRFVVF